MRQFKSVACLMLYKVGHLMGVDILPSHDQLKILSVSLNSCGVTNKYIKYILNVRSVVVFKN